LKLSDYASASDSKSLAAIDGKEFTITHVERNDYDDTKGVRFTTKETFELEGQPYCKFHTTRQAIVGKFLDDSGSPKELFNAVNNGGELKVKVISKKSSNGRNYFDLEQE